MPTTGSTPRRPSFLRRQLGAATQAVLLMGLWLGLSGHYDAFHVALGVLSVAIILWINRKIRRLPVAPNQVPARFEFHLFRLIAYFFWLTGQIFLSAWYVAKVILARRMPIQPQLVRFRSAQPNAFAQMILANSITLTPGTLTADLEGDEFLIHALTGDTAGGLLDGSMQTKVARLFEDEPGPMVFDVRVEGAEP
ncbi:MAG: Na+/H+ antiporter subunit E [Deferrisomatales bacterium]